MGMRKDQVASSGARLVSSKRRRCEAGSASEPADRLALSISLSCSAVGVEF